MDRAMNFFVQFLPLVALGACRLNLPSEYRPSTKVPNFFLPIFALPAALRRELTIHYPLFTTHCLGLLRIPRLRRAPPCRFSLGFYRYPWRYYFPQCRHPGVVEGFSHEHQPAGLCPSWANYAGSWPKTGVDFCRDGLYRRPTLGNVLRRHQTG